MFEEQALRAVLLEGGSVSGLFSTTLSIVLWLIALLALIAPVVLAIRRSRATVVEEQEPVSR